MFYSTVLAPYNELNDKNPVVACVTYKTAFLWQKKRAMLA